MTGRTTNYGALLLVVLLLAVVLRSFLRGQGGGLRPHRYNVNGNANERENPAAFSVLEERHDLDHDAAE